MLLHLQGVCVCVFYVQELGLLDDNNEPLTHAQYHKEEVQEAGKRMRRPCSLEIPKELKDKMSEYLTQVCCPLPSLLPTVQYGWFKLGCCH